MTSTDNVILRRQQPQDCVYAGRDHVSLRLRNGSCRLLTVREAIDMAFRLVGAAHEIEAGHANRAALKLAKQTEHVLRDGTCSECRA